jgi:hypothetical protein
MIEAVTQILDAIAYAEGGDTSKEVAEIVGTIDAYIASEVAAKDAEIAKQRDIIANRVHSEMGKDKEIERLREGIQRAKELSEHGCPDDCETLLCSLLTESPADGGGEEEVE